MPMSSTASPRRTEHGAASAAAIAGRVAAVVAALILTALFLSFRPFQLTGELDLTGGDVVNQLGYGALGALSVAAMLMLTDRRRLAALASPWWLAMLVFLVLSVLTAPDPNAAMRAASFTVIGILAVAAVLALPRDGEALSLVFAFAAFAVLAISYLGLAIFPDIARHTAADAFEPEHAGLWRGVFQHKNVAGPVMASFSFAGLLLVRRGWRAAGLLLLALSLLFVANTGSKTTLGLVPVAMAMVIGPGMIGLRALTPVLFGLAVVGTALATLGIVFVGPLHALADQMAPGLTYTGRTTLWQFAGELIAARPWTGYGFESVWGTPLVTDSDHPFDRDWDIRGVVHAHNGYLDVALSMGLPGLAAAVATLLVVPAIDYLRTPLNRDNLLTADFFMIILLFTSLNSFLESYLFRRADPIWILFVLAALGLRLTARMPMRAKGRLP